MNKLNQLETGNINNLESNKESNQKQHYISDKQNDIKNLIKYKEIKIRQKKKVETEETNLNQKQLINVSLYSSIKGNNYLTSGQENRMESGVGSELQQILFGFKNGDSDEANFNAESSLQQQIKDQKLVLDQSELKRLENQNKKRSDKLQLKKEKRQEDIRIREQNEKLYIEAKEKKIEEERQAKEKAAEELRRKMEAERLEIKRKMNEEEAAIGVIEVKVEDDGHQQKLERHKYCMRMWRAAGWYFFFSKSYFNGIRKDIAKKKKEQTYEFANNIRIQTNKYTQTFFEASKDIIQEMMKTPEKYIIISDEFICRQYNCSVPSKSDIKKRNVDTNNKIMVLVSKLLTVEINEEDIENIYNMFSDRSPLVDEFYYHTEIIRLKFDTWGRLQYIFSYLKLKIGISLRIKFKCFYYFSLF